MGEIDKTVAKPSAIVKMLKRIVIILLLLIIASGAIWFWYIRERIAHIHLEDTINEKTTKIELRVDERSDKIEMKLDRIEGKFDRIENKLDRLLYLLEPRLPDGMSQSE